MPEELSIAVAPVAAPAVPVQRFPQHDEVMAIFTLADRLTMTSFVPRSFQGKPAEAAAAMLYGRELGIGPMQSLQGINVIEGKPTASPELMRALIRGAGHKLDITTGGTACTIRGTRGDTGETATASFTLDDAVQARLVTLKDGKPFSRSSKGNALPWETYTSDMLLARATSRIARMLFSDVISGVSYTPEEMQSVVPPPIEIPDGYETLATAKRRFLDETGDKASAIELWGKFTASHNVATDAKFVSIELLETFFKDNPGEADIVEAEIVEAQTTKAEPSVYDFPDDLIDDVFHVVSVSDELLQSVAGVTPNEKALDTVTEIPPTSSEAGAYLNKITKGQIAKIHTLVGKIGISDERYRKGLRERFGVESSKDLSQGQADEFIQLLSDWLNKIIAEGGE